MRFDAVIFDFYGTLTHPVSRQSHEQAVGPVAAFLGVGIDELTDFYRETYDQRATGQWGDLKEAAAEMARRLRPDAEFDLSELTRVRRESVQHQLWNLRDDAVSTLGTLKGMGLKTGLISDCTHELAMAWPELPVAEHVDVPVFSVVEKVKKPDPLIYRTAIERLDAEPGRIMFVGDGGSNELQGAADMGMTPVWIDDDEAGNAVIYGHRPWEGLRVQALNQVLNLLDR